MLVCALPQNEVLSKVVFREQLVVYLAHQLKILGCRAAAASERVDVVDFEAAPLRTTPAVRADERALASIASVHFAFHLVRDVAAVLGVRVRGLSVFSIRLLPIRGAWSGRRCDTA